jgi:hypothetical protein
MMVKRRAGSWIFFLLSGRLAFCLLPVVEVESCLSVGHLHCNCCLGYPERWHSAQAKQGHLILKNCA